MKVCTLPAALALLAASVTSASADVVKLQREDVAAAMSLRWIGDDGVRRSDSHAELHTFESGNSDFLQFAVAAVPSAVDRTEASYGTSYRRIGSMVEAEVNGAVVEDRPEARFNHNHQLAFELTFAIVLMVPSLTPWYALAGVVFHAGTAVFLRIHYLKYLGPVYTVFVTEWGFRLMSS